METIEGLGSKLDAEIEKDVPEIPIVNGIGGSGPSVDLKESVEDKRRKRLTEMPVKMFELAQRIKDGQE
jgi:hypothetical protein